MEHMVIKIKIFIVLKTFRIFNFLEEYIEKLLTEGPIYPIFSLASGYLNMNS